MTGYTDLSRSYRSRASVEQWTEDDIPSTFTETVEAAFTLARREEISTSAARAWAGKNIERGKKIAELGGNEQIAREYGTIPREALEHLHQAAADGVLEQDLLYQSLTESERESYQLVRDYVRRFPEEVTDDEALFEEFKTEAAKLRAGEQHVLERGGMGGQFVGTAGAMFTDPLILGTLPFGAAAGGGRTLAQVFGRTAAVEGSLAMATEIPIQAAVFQFKRELEAPWTLKDSAINVLAATLGGAGLGGTIGTSVTAGRRAANLPQLSGDNRLARRFRVAGAVEAITDEVRPGGAAAALGRTGAKSAEARSRLLELYREAKADGRVEPTPALEEAERILAAADHVESQNPLRVDDEPMTPAHEAALDKARAQAERGEPVNVRDDVEAFEPNDGIHQTLRRSEDPDELVDIDPAEVEVDARTFQFKSGSDDAGVTDALAGVRRFDRRLAGVSLIWERADGKRFIADGHQRRALALRAREAGQAPEETQLNGFVVREADGVTAADARQMAAIKNMAEGTGSALDAAKILRQVGELGDAMLPPLPPRSALVRQARGLAQLGDEEFLQVVNGVIDERFGALVGGATADPKLQQAMIEVIRKTQPANETQARSIIDQVRTVGTETTITEDLFGSNAITESLYLERAQVLDAALREARKDRTVFGRLVAEEGRITGAGENRLDRAANQQRIQEASDATAKISRLANAKGPISDALSEAARRVKAGEQPGRAAADFLETARREILEGNNRRPETGGARSSRDTPGAESRLEPEVGRPVRIADLAPQDRPAAVRALTARQAEQTLDDLYRVAESHQERLASIAEEIVAELGEDVQLANPGVKVRERAAEKLGIRGAAPGTITDVIRLGFLVRTPDLAAMIIERLGRQFEILDEGISVTGMGYLDDKALVRFDDGRVGEIQLWDPEMARAKFGRGEELYAEVRTISAEDLERDPALAARVLAATEESKDLYASALAAGSPEWRRVAMQTLPEDMRQRVQSLLEAGGSAGAPGNVSRNLFRESSTPELRTSTAETRDQASASSGTNRPSSPPSGVSRTAAGRDSQLKNRSAIDAPPRSIVRQVADERTGTPLATRTGTIDDTEYQAVLDQFEDLAENQGELLQVVSQVDDELVVRSARGTIEQLDELEESLERIRLCNTSTRNVA